MTYNDTAVKGLAWLAATLPTLVQQDCIHGDEINDVSVTSFNVTLHFNDYPTAARIAARLGLTVDPEFGGKGAADSPSTWWTGRHHLDGMEVRVVTMDPPRLVKPCVCDDQEHTCRALYGIPNRNFVPTECTDVLS